MTSAQGRGDDRHPVTEEWEKEPSAPEYQVDMVIQVLHDLRDLTNVTAGKVIGVSEGTIRRWRLGDIRPLRGTEERVRRYIASSDDATSGETEGALRQRPIREELLNARDRAVPLRIARRLRDEDDGPRGMLLALLVDQVGWERVARELDRAETVGEAAYTIAIEANLDEATRHRIVELRREIEKEE